MAVDSFDLADDPPCVTVAAAYSKRRRKDRQPMRGDMAARLGPYLAGIRSASLGRPADKPAREGARGKVRRTGAPTTAVAPAAWPGSWSKRSADMLAADLLDAGVERVAG